MDDLERYIADQKERDPKFLSAYQAALERRRYATRIAQVRAERGFSQESLAEAVSSTQAVISRLESGADFRFSTLQKVTHALGFAAVSEVFSQPVGSGTPRKVSKASRQKVSSRKRAARRASTPTAGAKKKGAKSAPKTRART